MYFLGEGGQDTDTQKQRLKETHKHRHTDTLMDIATNRRRKKLFPSNTNIYQKNQEKRLFAIYFIVLNTFFDKKSQFRKISESMGVANT